MVTTPIRQKVLDSNTKYGKFGGYTTDERQTVDDVY